MSSEHKCWRGAIEETHTEGDDWESLKIMRSFEDSLENVHSNNDELAKIEKDFLQYGECAYRQIVDENGVTIKHVEHFQDTKSKESKG